MKPAAYKLKDKFNGTRTDERGNVFWYKDGLLHRDGDLPAIEYSSGKKMWYQFGLKHRDNAPAVIWADRSEIWFRHGLRHREGGPAEDFGDSKRWYRDGLLHREDGPAMVRGNTKWWYRNDLLHRDDGPAIESSNGAKSFYLFGEKWPEGEAVTNGDYTTARIAFVRRMMLSNDPVTAAPRIRLKGHLAP
jgi:hypothetical protein